MIYPVYGPEDFPDDNRFVYVRAEFTTQSGVIFHGFIIGVINIFSVAIFWDGETLLLNKNIINNCLKAIEKINATSDVKFTLEDFSPLKFETQINLEGFKNINGEFDLLKTRSNDERLA